MTTHALPPLPLTPHPRLLPWLQALLTVVPGWRVTVWLTHGRWERCECQSWASPREDPHTFRQLLGVPQGCARPHCVPHWQAHTEPGPGPIQSSPVLWQLPALPLPIPCWGPWALASPATEASHLWLQSRRL